MKLTLIFILIIIIEFTTGEDGVCDKDGLCSSPTESPLNLDNKYVFYDVNPPEGFNLRRDVYMRMAIMVKKLRNKGNYYLVLPPWQHLYHWQSHEIYDQSRLPWGMFFDIKSLAEFAPVIEMYEFLQTGAKDIEQVYVLQNFEDTFTSGNFKDRMKIESCLSYIPYERNKDNGYKGPFWGYRNITGKKVDCLSFHGYATQLIDFIESNNRKTIMFDHAEVVLHHNFGDKTYWDCRKSMKFAQPLVQEAGKFIAHNIDSTYKITDSVSEERTATGAPFLCVHLRRKDFLRGRPKQVPSLKNAAAQIDKALEELKLNTVFVATDAPDEEKLQLKSYLEHRHVQTYEPSPAVKKRWKDGGIAIVEQIICSQARKFIGSHESTFSFRIQEEREIMGFPLNLTFSRLCGDEERKCTQPTGWQIVH